MATKITVLMQSQLIAAALLGSCVIFGGVVMFALNSSAGGVGGGDFEIINTLAAVLGATSIPLAFFVRRQIWSRRSAVEGDARDNLFRIGARFCWSFRTRTPRAHSCRRPCGSGRCKQQDTGSCSNPMRC